MTGGVEQARDWRDDLALTERLRVCPILGNAVLILENEPELQVLGWNEHGDASEIVSRPPWAISTDTRTWPSPVREDDVTRLGLWIQLHYAGVSFATDKLHQAIEAVARRRPFDPVRKYLESLEWDGQPRCRDWLSRYFAVEATSFSEVVGARWLISGVARALKPGCKADCVLIFEGLQGKKKSQALAVLAGSEWFKDDGLDMNSREGPIALEGTWIYELAELASIKKSEIESVKAFLSRQEDRFRPMYGRRTVKRPRRCIFAASTNEDHYLTDATGARRFWPVRCRQIDLDGLREARDQLWAESVAHYLDGDIWWIEEDELVELQSDEVEKRYNRDIWEDRLAEWAADRDELRMLEAFDALGVREADLPKLQHRDSTRMGIVLQRLGFAPAERPRGGDRTRPRLYRRVEARGERSAG